MVIWVVGKGRLQKKMGLSGNFSQTRGGSDPNPLVYVCFSSKDTPVQICNPYLIPCHMRQGGPILGSFTTQNMDILCQLASSIHPQFQLTLSLLIDDVGC